VRVWENKLVGVLDDDETLVVGDRRGERAEQRALARSGGPAYEDARPLANAGLEKRSRVIVKAARDPRGGGSAQRDRKTIELSNGETRTADRRDHGIRTAAIPHPRVDEGPLERELAADAAGDAMRDLGDIIGVAKREVDALEAAGTLAEDVTRAVDQDVGDVRVVEERLKRSEAEQLGTDRIDVGLADRYPRRQSHALAKECTSPGLRVGRQQSRGIDADRDLGAHACNERRVGHASARSSTSTARSVGARAANASSAR